MKILCLLALTTLIGCKARHQDSAVQAAASPSAMQFPLSFAGNPGECVTFIDPQTVAVSPAIGFGQSWSSTISMTSPPDGEKNFLIDVPHTVARERVSDAPVLSARLAEGDKLLTIDATIHSPEHSDPKSSKQFMIPVRSSRFERARPNSIV